MRFVVDANILFSLAKPLTASNKLVSKFGLELVAPDFALIELYKHKEELVRKSGLDFNSIINSLKDKVVFVDKSEYSGLMKNFKSKISDISDIPYLALADKLNLPIWSLDPHLKEQMEIEIFTTAELIGFID